MVALVLWLALVVIGVGSHGAIGVDVGPWSGSPEHQPWHRHFVDDGVSEWMRGLDHCLVCSVHNGLWAIVSVPLRPHPAGDRDAAVPQLPSHEPRLHPAAGPPPRAPPVH